MNKREREFIPNDKSFQLVIKEEHKKLFKILLPVVILIVPFLAIITLYKNIFLYVYAVLSFATVMYIFYTYHSYKQQIGIVKNNGSRVREIKFFRELGWVHAFYIGLGFFMFNSFSMVFIIRNSYPFSLILFSIILTIIIAATFRIIVRNFLAGKTLSPIEIITFFITALLWYLYMIIA